MFERLNATEPREREQAWVDFLTRYGPVIAAFARRCGASPQDINDIVQDVTYAFLSVSSEFRYDPARGRFRGWLKTCTVRAAIRRAGKNLRFRGVPLDQLQDTELAVDPVWNDIWEQQLVARAISQLRHDYGTTLAFKAFEQYVLLDRSAEKVAEELNTTLDNVHQAKTRMLKRLRGIVAQLRSEEN